MDVVRPGLSPTAGWCVTATKPQEAHESGDCWRDTAHKTENVRYIVGQLKPCVMRNVDCVIGQHRKHLRAGKIRPREQCRPLIDARGSVSAG